MKMRPLVTKVVVINQQSNDPKSAWAQARFKWVKQLAVQFRVLDPTQFKDPPLNITNEQQSQDTQSSELNNNSKVTLNITNDQHSLINQNTQQTTQTNNISTSTHPITHGQQSQVGTLSTNANIAHEQRDAAVVAAPRLTLTTATAAQVNISVTTNTNKVDLDGVAIPKKYDPDFLPPID